MKVEVRFVGLQSSEALREHALQRTYFHLGRFGHEVMEVLVRISDINGPRGGLDKRCQVAVRGPRFGAITLDEVDADAYLAVGLAIDRTSRALRRTLTRAQSRASARRAPAWVAPAQGRDEPLQRRAVRARRAPRPAGEGG